MGKTASGDEGTDLERVLLLDREGVDRGRILAHLLEGMVRSTGPTSVARASGVLSSVNESPDGVSGGNSGRHRAQCERKEPMDAPVLVKEKFARLIQTFINARDVRG